MLSRSTIFLGLMLTGTLALASLVREDESASGEVVLPVPRTMQAQNAAVYPALPLEKLVRTGLDDPGHNPFAGKSWSGSSSFPLLIPGIKNATQSSDEAGPPLDEQPATAPGLPFRYMGRIQEEGGRPVVFFTQGSQAYTVSEGEAIDESYRLERVLPTQLVLVHLPLKTRQTLDIASLDAEPGDAADEAWAETHLTYSRDLQTAEVSRETAGGGR